MLTKAGNPRQLRHSNVTLESFTIERDEETSQLTASSTEPRCWPSDRERPALPDGLGQQQKHHHDRPRAHTHLTMATTTTTITTTMPHKSRSHQVYVHVRIVLVLPR